MSADLVIPAAFRLIADYVVDIVLAAKPHKLHQLLLQYIGKHLGVVASGFVTPADRGIEVA